jgi:hypothetical protein
VLAYVFWHWQQADAATTEYERWLCHFHAALAAAPPAGLVRSRAFALQGAPWANAGHDAYEDWYHLGGSADLDALNDAAVSGSRRLPHEGAAALAAGGTAGLYRLRLGDPATVVRRAHWFPKPRDATYASFLNRLTPLVTSTGGALWQRQMTLGPAAEFCLQVAEDAAVPADIGAREVAMRAVFPNHV